MTNLTSIEICAGAGGQALGLEMAGYEPLALVELDSHAATTLRLNRPNWNVIEGDVHRFHATPYRGNVDLFAGGVPCPPFSAAGKQLGWDDERDLFPQALRLVSECRPRAVMLENVRGLLNPKFAPYRDHITYELQQLGYAAFWKLLNASDYSVPQLRPRVILVALQPEYASQFRWPDPHAYPARTVGDVLHAGMASRGWQGADAWRALAQGIAPTLVGGSKKHGGPDLGPTRAKRAWAALGVNAHTLADQAPDADFRGMPRLTVKMAAEIQGFPADWQIHGRKTAAYRQVGNAFPPPVARVVGESIRRALQAELGSHEPANPYVVLERPQNVFALRVGTA